VSRSNIIPVAIKMFINDGFSAATTRRIANAAGVAKGTLHDAYGSKDALFRHAIRSLEAAFFDEFCTTDLESACSAVGVMQRHVEVLRLASVQHDRRGLQEKEAFLLRFKDALQARTVPLHASSIVDALDGAMSLLAGGAHPRPRVWEHIALLWPADATSTVVQLPKKAGPERQKKSSVFARHDVALPPSDERDKDGGMVLEDLRIQLRGVVGGEERRMRRDQRRRERDALGLRSDERAWRLRPKSGTIRLR